MEFSDHTSRMTHDPTTVTAHDQSFINIHQPINHLSILTHPERVESIIKLIGIFRYLHQSFGLLTFVRIIVSIIRNRKPTLHLIIVHKQTLVLFFIREVCHKKTGPLQRKIKGNKMKKRTIKSPSTSRLFLAQKRM